ncbi:MAG TPA: hypothetical protein PLJ34_06110, partial [Hyphomicrobiales bacterium]|nr:hypothetical protein [Hyphomicrobiales bacterium]
VALCNCLCADAAVLPAYDRRAMLPRLLPLAPADLAEDWPALTRRLVARLARALRAERRRGRAGLAGYDIGRHLALARVLRAERQRLDGKGEEPTIR